MNLAPVTYDSSVLQSTFERWWAYLLVSIITVLYLLFVSYLVRVTLHIVIVSTYISHLIVYASNNTESKVDMRKAKRMTFVYYYSTLKVSQEETKAIINGLLLIINPHTWRPYSIRDMLFHPNIGIPALTPLNKNVATGLYHWILSLILTPLVKVV